MGVKNLLYAATISLMFAWPGVGWGQEVAVVLSSDLGPYREAFEGFQGVFDQTVSSYNLSRDKFTLSPGIQIVVAFGGKAALYPYPEDVTLIYCMAPGIEFRPGDRRGHSVAIGLMPRASSILPKLKEIQPSLKRLGVFWSSGFMKRQIEGLRQASAPVGIEIISYQLKSPEELPEGLRSLYKEIDAIWLMPDPLLINSQSFKILKEFSWSNKVPFYAPTAGLVEQGATASISTSFSEIGRMAGLTARQILLDSPVPNEVYPERIQMTINMKAAGQVGLQIPGEVLQKADKVWP